MNWTAWTRCDDCGEAFNPRLLHLCEKREPPPDARPFEPRMMVVSAGDVVEAPKRDPGQVIIGVAVDGTDAGWRRANALADRCQELEDENRDLLVENARLRREIERLRR